MVHNKVSWKNSQQEYGLLSKLLHWLSALTVFSLFALGYWMVELNYSSKWYQLAPHWHESLGILLLMVTIFRLLWRRIAGSPGAITSHSAFEKKASALMIFILYITLFTVLISGYLITSANDKAIAVFDWFKVIPWVLGIKNQEDIAGVVHYYLAYGIIIFALLHALAALKHHFIDQDVTLKRMTKITDK
ncbi:cytochrome b [Colwellia sp. MB3u-70]|uniref:cytochrome b n=1 Tax=unclassified Colwellia TaxID=196834 RepID=UPI0015F3C8A4|nr:MULTISPECIES: cytochrome b [unclassified Colwellia]MBA6294317.1 cytochrome b [Colwellia sp. MB3u-8]MBA6306932.1 cytochrome b [Colwellia sp. MB3u-70]